jgi:hypothetical protein
MMTLHRDCIDIDFTTPTDDHDIEPHVKILVEPACSAGHCRAAERLHPQNLHQAGLHRPEHQCQAVRLYQTISKIFVEFYIANTNIAKVYIHVVFCRRQEKSRRHRDLRSPPPPPTTRSAAAAEYLPSPQNTCRRRLKPRRRRRIPAAAALKPAAAADPLPPLPKTRNFLRLRLYVYNDHDNLNHGYIGYLDIDIKNNVCSNSSTPVNSVRIVTCVQATPAVTAGRKRSETRKAPEVLTHQRCC